MLYHRKIIFTDLDESLLNKNKFDAKVLGNFIKSLLIENFSIIAITSKTYFEVIDLLKKNNLNFPFSTENGAVFYMPSNTKIYNKKVNFRAKKNNIIKKILFEKINKNYTRFIKLIEYLDLNKQINITKLKKNDIGKFLNREYSVPILWEGDNCLFELFKNDLSKYNLKIVFGGKLWNISGNHNKLDAVKFYLKEFSSKCNEDKILTIAVGDSMNDVEMLNYTHYSGVVKNESTIKLKINNNQKNTFYSNLKAPEGWVDVIKNIKKCMEKDYN